MYIMAARLHQAPPRGPCRGAPAPPGLRGPLPAAAGAETAPPQVDLGRGAALPALPLRGGDRRAILAPVRSTVGVTSLVRFGGQVAEVPLKLIEGLRNAAEEPRAARLMFQQGRRVRIVTGDYATLEAVFDLAEGEERATVLLELLGRQSRVRVGVREIVSADYIDAYLLPFVRALTETASLIAVIAGIFCCFRQRRLYSSRSYLLLSLDINS